MKQRNMLKSFRNYLDTLDLLDYDDLRQSIDSELVWDDGNIRRNPASYEIFASHEHLDFAKEDIFKFSGIVLDLAAFEAAAKKVEEIWHRRLPELFPGHEFIIFKDEDHRQIAFCRKRPGITADPDEIIMFLGSAHGYVRWNAMLSATIFPNPKLVPHLIEHLDDHDIYNRLKAIIALGAQKDSRPIKTLQKRFLKPQKGPDNKLFVNDFFAYDLFNTLLKLGIKGYKLLFNLLRNYKNLDIHTLEHLCELLGGTGNQEVLDILLDIYYNEPEASQFALTGLLKMEQTALPAIIKGLSNRDPEIRQKAMWFLANCYIIDAYDYLVQCLRDRCAQVREAAVHGIGRFYHRNRKGLLINALDDRATNVRVKAVEALGNLFDRTLLPTFIELCSDGNPRVRHEAMRAIAALDSLVGIRFLSELYDRSTNPDKVRIIRSLYAYTGSPARLKPLINKAQTSGNKRITREMTDLLEIL